MNNMKSILIVATLSLASYQLLASAEPRFNDNNVCNKTITVKRDKRIEEPVSYEIPYNTVCDLVRTCVKYRTETRMNSRKVTVWEEKVVPTCCPGYAELPDQSCAPICVEGCRNGKCVAPNKCKCELSPSQSKPGYTGNTCSRFVCFDENKWGPDCQQECNCSPNAFCHAFTGKCICRTNWRGPNCTEPCESNKDPGCDEFTLLQVSEPEANMIPGIGDDTSPRSSALQLESQSQINGLTGGNPSEAAVRFRQRLEKITNELYYAATSSSSSDVSSTGGSRIYEEPSNYSVPSGNSVAAAMQKRPLVPTPPETEGSQLSKNLSFASATRNIIKGITASESNNTIGRSNATKDDGLRGKFLLDPLVESRLARSQDKSTNNVYCQPEIPKDDDEKRKVHEFSTLRVETSSNINQSLDGHYQVPKSPNVKSAPTTQPIETNQAIYSAPVAGSQPVMHNTSQNSTISNQYSMNMDIDAMGDDDDSNIYEEICPNNSDRK